jgi:alkanesulfonate monooxygenase SsuD/methylene tetrahydromethanopterin reductase-like flavin-dependent oxidoreductase (luciferase family)
MRRMRVCLMIEGQENVTWEDWRRLAVATETAGFEGLFRSDHYTSVMDKHDRGSLDAWGTICALAPITERIRLGTMVSPATFRHPSVLAKMVVTADHASGGRVELGLGTGWQEHEHEAYGFPFGTMRERMDRMAEQLEVITTQWTDGKHLFEPLQKPHPPLIMGGQAKPRAAALAARYADEYNVNFVDAEEAARRFAAIRAACESAGRDPSTMTYSLMTGFAIGSDPADVQRRAAEISEWSDRGTPDTAVEALRQMHCIVGTIPEALDQLRVLEAAGVQRIMLQHLSHWDLEVIDLIGREIIPAIA